MHTNQILYHTHPLTAQFSHQAVNIHKVVISDMLNEVVEGNKHTCSAHTSTEETARERHTIIPSAPPLQPKEKN